MGEPLSGAPQSTGMTAEDRLDSWKEIAAYLKRDATPVQRWEKGEAMPVRRHLHDKLGSVYAFRSELDTWARGRNLPASNAEIQTETLSERPDPSTGVGNDAERTLESITSPMSPSIPRRAS